MVILDVDYGGVLMRSLKIAISVPENIFSQAEEEAKIMGLSRSGFYATALAEFIERHREDHITSTLNAIYAETDSRMDVVLAGMQAASLSPEEW